MSETQCHSNLFKLSYLDKCLGGGSAGLEKLFNTRVFSKNKKKRGISYMLQHSHKVCDGVLMVSVKRTAGRLVFSADVGSDGGRSRSARKAETRTGKAAKLIQRAAKVGAGWS